MNVSVKCEFMSLFLIRYGEIALKSPRVRGRFERILVQNIQDAFAIRKIECLVRREWGRLFLTTDEDAKAVDALKHVFGVVSISKVNETSSELSNLIDVVSTYSKRILKNGQSFAIRARRVGTHQYTSMSLARELGAAVLSANKGKKIHVNLSKPDAEISVEVREKKAYLYSQVVQCVGGMPLGSQGIAVTPVVDELSLLAGWFLMKRGCKSVFVTDKKSAKSVFASIQPWDTRPEVYAFALKCKGVRRRSLLWKKTSQIAEKVGAYALVSSADVQNIDFRADSRMPVFYPLVGLDKKEIERYWKRAFEV